VGFLTARADVMSIRARKRTPGHVAAVACLLVSLGTAAQLCDAQKPPSQYEVEAAFLLNFTRFVEWPAEAFLTPDSPITICVLGRDPFGPALDETVEGEVVQKRPVAARRVRDVPRSQPCQVLFFSPEEQDNRFLLRDAGPGVLTVGENDDFLKDGGMIQFVIADRHVRFDINEKVAEEAKLKLSSQLLKVARSVR
jgi:uncharacterized protein DUF4154